MAETLYPLNVPPIPWHTVGLHWLTHLHLSNGVVTVVIMVGHPTRMAHFLPCTIQRAQQERKPFIYSYTESTDYTDYPEC
jgi:hypothetical protein